MFSLFLSERHSWGGSEFLNKTSTNTCQGLPEVGSFYTWSFFRGSPNCDDVMNTPRYDERDDVSGDKQGVACDGGGCFGTPEDVDRLEFNTDFGHYTIYKDRNNDLFDLGNNNVGHCTVDTSDDYECVSGPFPSPLSGKRWYFCQTSVTP